MSSFEEKVKANKNIVRRGQNYLDEFIEAFSELNEEYTNSKLLSLKDVTQDSQYLQGLAEALFYKFFAEQGIVPKTDVKVNGTNKDVDLVIETSDVKINIEVKCPIIQEDEPDILHISTGYRYSNDKKVHQSIFNSVIEELIKNFENNPNKTYKAIKCEKLDDNKLKDYLESAQSKFGVPRKNECNVLILALTTKDFIRFFDYIANSRTGLFSGNSFVNPKSFDKLDCIILTNIISGHYKYKLDINIWDVKEYITFLLPNCNKHMRNNYIVPNNAEKLLMELFGNLLDDFKKFEVEFYKLNCNLPRSIQITLPSYKQEISNCSHKSTKVKICYC